MLQNQLQFLGIGHANYTGIVEKTVNFTLEKQLKNRANWKRFVEAFQTNADIHDDGWRGEYWGKMMRGACLIYQYCQDEELYGILEETVRDLLAAQDAQGRISAYDVAHEFAGWDMWARKYVLTGMLHFYRVCKDATLKKEILAAMLRHTAYITAKIGDKEGQKPICETSHIWGGINSCSILEPILDLYNVTGEKYLFDFATYIVNTGGCKDGNVIEAALENQLRPFEYPVHKAYETMSFFEGLLAYYQITGEEKYFCAVKNFVTMVQNVEVTVVGSAGCKCEEFNNSAQVQTEYTENMMQETCVTVTWMRLLCKLYAFTGEKQYAEQIEISARNALYGSLNYHGLQQYAIEQKDWLKIPLPFDSYSPLVNHRRGRATGGLKFYTDGFFYGCCACIAAAGIAIYPLYAIMQAEDGICVNALLEGTVSTTTFSGKAFTLRATGDLLYSKKMRLTLHTEEEKGTKVRIRIPAWCDRLTALSDMASVSEKADELVILVPCGGEVTVDLSAEFDLRRFQRNGKTAFQYGPLIVARDAIKEGVSDLMESLSLKNDGEVTLLAPRNEEQLRLLVKKEDGSDLLLTDYASCGGEWTREDAKVSVWLEIQ